MEKAIEAKNLSYVYTDGTEALKRVSIVVFEGESVALIGPNGAGKSTLLLHLNGILKPKSGNTMLFGMEVTEDNLREIRRMVGLVFQDPNDQLFSPTVFDDVAFGPINAGLTEKEVEKRVVKALEMVELAGFEERSPHHLSFGEKKRVSIATVLSMEPKILILDEPTLGLDPWIRRDFLKIIEKLRKNHTILVATHDLELAESCSRTYMLEKGTIKPVEKPLTPLIRSHTG